MTLGLRVLLGFFIINGIAAYIGLRLFVAEVRPSVREVMEDLMVDTANILAELACDDLARLPAAATLEHSPFAQRVRDYANRPVDARIWGLAKRTLDYRVYVTDAKGRVVFDSGFRGSASAVGSDYSQWRDVALTLSGRYGARATREVRTDETSSVMYVAAPVRSGDAVIGVLTVAKPMSTVQQFVSRAEREIFVRGAWLLGLSAALGALITGWLVWSVRRLRRYAQGVQLGQRVTVPRLSGELGDLARAMQDMRERLEGRDHVEGLVRALTHELKSPLTAIAGAAELLRDPLPAADREIFAQQIQTQSVRLRKLVERLLELSKLEQRRELDRSARIDLTDCARAAQDAASARALQRGVAIELAAPNAVWIVGDHQLLQLALSNLLDNAVDFEPVGKRVILTVQARPGEAVLSVRDHGVGVPPYAMPRLGERFFSLPRPATDGTTEVNKGSGLGLAIVRQIVELHGGTLRFADAHPGLRVEIRLPQA